MKAAPLLILATLFTATGCSSTPPRTTCEVDLSLVQDVPFPKRPSGAITNGWMLDALRELKAETEADKARNDELIRQLEKCIGG